MREHNPHVKILVAQIIPMDPAKSCSGCAQGVIALNDAIPDWASGKSTDQSPIIVVDQWTGFDTDTDTYDGVHPNNAGNQKIADRWYSAMASLLAK
jgi:lysophospholipase L1-like esterase